MPSVAAALVAIAVSATLAASAPPAITPTSIAGAKLGLGKVAYTRILGRPVRYQAAGGGAYQDPGFQLPQDYARLFFPKRKTYVYFQDGIDHALEIVTWNKGYRTAERVGPCSSFAQVKKAYGRRLKPNRANTTLDGTVFSYLVGRSLIFEFSDVYHGGTPAEDVSAVALFDGSGPGGLKPGGPLYLASYVALAPYQVPCDHS